MYEAKAEIEDWEDEVTAMSWKERVARFLQGRYGVDQFSKFLVGAAMVCILLSGLLRNRFFHLLGWVCLAYIYVRMLSRNFERRYAENQAYLRVQGKVLDFFRRQKSVGTAADREHKIYKCPACGQKTRVPRGRGKIEIDCPRCHHKFIKRT